MCSPTLNGIRKVATVNVDNVLLIGVLKLNEQPHANGEVASSIPGDDVSANVPKSDHHPCPRASPSFENRRAEKVNARNAARLRAIDFSCVEEGVDSD